MSIAPGARLGPYEILAPLGAGGMGEVYRARDTKLQRDVAIKILPDAFASDAERVARFTREAQTLATLNHPHIAQIHGLEEAGDVRALVMELVEGEDLAARIARGAIPIDEALAIAQQVANGLEAAHEKGIIHRDLKPANIKITPEGMAKILDFGLAKAAARESPHDLAQSPTFTVAATQMGMIVGTAAYMSPEQARGRPVDKRADIWAFGCVLYEMTSGLPVFRGDAVSDLLASIMRDEPTMSALPPAAPESVRRLILHCLRKDPRERLRDIGDVRCYLEDAPQFAPAARGAPRQRFLTIASAAAAALIIGLAVWEWRRPAAAPGPLMKVVVPTPELSRVSGPALSPTGDRIAFIGDGRLWVRFLADSVARPIAGTDGAVQPFWSPDGRHIGYFVGPRILAVAVDGGAPALVAQMDQACAAEVCTGSWTDDGRMLVSAGFSGVYSVSARSGALTPHVPAGERDHHHEVSALPAGRGALVTVDPDEGSEWIAVWDGRERRKLLDNARRGVYSSTGHVIFSRAGGLWAIPFSLDTLLATGEAFRVHERAAEPSVSLDGSLLYVTAGRREQELVWVDRSGSVRETVGSYEGSASSPDVSPDGRRVAFVSTTEARGQIWMFEPGRGVRTPLVVEPGLHQSPVWTADGSTLYYVTVSPGEIDAEHMSIHLARLGGGTSSVVARGSEPSTSGDSRYLTWTTGDAADRRINYLDLHDAASGPKPFAAAAGIAGSARLSPDGRSIAYVQGDWASGRFEVYVSSFPDGRDKAQVSSGGITYRTHIRWNGRGDRLFYVRNADGALMEAAVRLDGAVQLSPPRVLFTESSAKLNLDDGFGVNADGSQFLVVRESVPHGAEAGAFMLVRNWIEEFRR